jgi:branched-chain amino acid transport system substrate-binding protein
LKAFVNDPPQILMSWVISRALRLGVGAQHAQLGGPSGLEAVRGRIENIGGPTALPGGSNVKRRDLLIGGSAMFAAGMSRAAKADTAVITFGQSASLTGGQASYGKDVRDGILAAFNAANRADTKLRFELVSLDDGGDKERCKANVKKLIGTNAAALVGLTSGAAAEACLPIVEENKIVLLGTASGNMGIRNDKLTMAYHVRSGYDDEYKRMLAYVKEFNMSRVGYVYLKDTSPANQAAMTAALDAVGMKVALSVPLDRNSKSFDAEAQALLDAKLDCVLFTTNAHPISSIIGRMSAAKYAGFYFSSSFAGQALIDDMTGKGQSIIMSQVVPRPNAVAYGVVKRCMEDLAALGTDARMGFTSLEGYIAGRVAVEASRAAMKGAGGDLTRQKFRQSLADLSLDLNGYKTHFTPHSPSGSRFVDVVAIDRTGRIIG